MFENNQFERQRTRLKDNVKVDLREKCFGIERKNLTGSGSCTVMEFTRIVAVINFSILVPDLD